MRPFHRWLFLLGAPAVALALFLQAPRPGGGIEAPSEARRLPLPDAESTFEARSAPVLPLVAVHDAVETGSGWTVLDATDSRLLWLDASGRPVVAAGGAGQGPGEMTSPGALALAGEDVLVLETLGGPAHRFDGGGRFVERLPPPGGACPFGSLLEAHGRGRDVFVLRACPSPHGTLRVHLERWEPGGATRPVHHEVVENLRETLSPFRRASAAALPSGVAYGMAHDACALVLSAAGAARSFCPAREARPLLPDAAAERAHAVLGARARAAGVRLVVPERAPPFEAVAAAGGRLAFLVRPRAGALAMDLVDGDGRVTRVEVRGADRLFAGPRSLLAVRETLQGPAVTVVPLP